MSREIMLGDEARDRITGLKGIVVAITRWLNGCNRITIQPQTLHEGKPGDSATFDAEQVDIVTEGAMVPLPRPTGGPSIPPVRKPDPR